MIDENVIKGLKKRYPHINTLLFHRSMERANSAGDLFDILESFPSRYPVVWDYDNKKWESTDDIFQSDNYGKNNE